MKQLELNEPTRRKVYINHNLTMYYSEFHGHIQVKLNLPGAKWRNSLFSPYDFQKSIEYNLLTPVGLEMV